jgi:hypothetical protein
MSAEYFIVHGPKPQADTAQLVTVEGACEVCLTPFIVTDCELRTTEIQTITGKVFCRGCCEVYFFLAEGDLEC